MEYKEIHRIVTQETDLILYKSNGDRYISMVTEDGEEISLELENSTIKDLIKALTDML